MKSHHITLDEIQNYRNLSSSPPAADSENISLKSLAAAEPANIILSKLFSYLGGIFIFSGYFIYLNMQWSGLSSSARILLTLGVGFVLFLMGVYTSLAQKFEKSSTPFFIMASIFEASGILILLDEFSRGGDPIYGLLFLYITLGTQFFFTFLKLNRIFLLLISLICFYGSIIIVMDLLRIDNHLMGASIGLSLGFIGWALDRSKHFSLASFSYFLGSLLFLSISFSWFYGKPSELIILGFSSLAIYISTITKSRSILFNGTICLLSYIGAFMAKHFANNVNGPLLLVIMGFLLMGIGYMAIYINKKYIRT